MEAAPHPWPAIGVLLLRDGLVTKDQLEAVLAEQRDSRQQRMSGWRLGETLVERGVVTQEQVARLIAEQYELPFIELDESAIDTSVSDRLPDHLAERFSALPIELLADGSLMLAVADPATVLFSDELRRTIGMPLRFVVVSPADLRAAMVSLRSKAFPATSPDAAPTMPTGGPAAELAATHDRAQSQSDVSDDPTPGYGPPSTPSIWPPLGTLLVRDGLVSEEELETALAQQRLSSNKRLGEILVERGSVTRADVARIVAEQYELPFIDIVESELDTRIGALLPYDIARRYLALPLRFETDGSLLVAVADPTKVLDPEEILGALGARFSFAVADPDTIESAILRQRLEAHSATEAVTTLPPSQPPQLENPVPEQVAEPVEENVAPPSDEASLDAALREELHAFAESGPGELPDDETSAMAEPASDVVDVEETVARVESAPQTNVAWESAVTEASDPVEDGATLASDELSFDTTVPHEPHPFTEADHILSPEDETPVEIEPASEDVVELDETAALAGNELVTDGLLDPDVPDATPASDVSEPVAPAPIEPDDAFERSVDDDPEGVEVPDEVVTEPEEGAQHRPLYAVVELDSAADSPDAPPALEEPASIEDDHGEHAEPEVEAPTEDYASAAVGDTSDRDTEPSALDVVVRLSVPEHLPDDPVVPEVAPAALEPEADFDPQDVLERAISLGASSLHFSAQEHGLVARARVDGVIRELEVLSGEERANAEHVLGELARSSHRHDVEVTVLPTQYGETVTVRFRPASESVLSLADLLLSSDDEESLRSTLAQPAGLVLVTGSAGSGRTTTLYAALQELVSPERALMTVEDPVFHVMRGVDQVAVDRRSGLSFARALRTILRADPDVILVGEIADPETATLAVHAASSRLVLSTALAPTATSAISRLLGMGVSPDELASTLTALVTQRLVRRICTDCRESYYPTAEELVELGRPEDEARRRLLGRGRGCAACGGTGYRGRAGVLSLLPLTDEIRVLLAGHAPPAEIERAALAAGARTLRDETVRLCLDGVTTAHEVRRVAGSTGIA